MSRLFLSSLRLGHFRSHRQAALELDGRPVAIFGPNGAGKTNILEAISLLSPGRGLRRARGEDLPRRPDGPGWKVRADLVSLEQRHEVETWAEAGRPRQARIDGKAAPQVALGRIARILWLVPAMDRLWSEGAEGRRRFLDRIAMSFAPAHADAALAYEKAMRERNRLLRDQIGDPHWYEALERQMAHAGAQVQAQRQAALERLQEMPETGGFPVARLSITDADGAPAHPQSADELQAALAASRPRDMAAGRTLVGPHRADLAAVYAAKGMAARDCSTGEQKALLISLILANAQALAQDFGAPPILLLDEVAAHLDASRRAALYDQLCALGAQAFLTGTGAELFAALGPRAQFFEVTETAGTSSIRETAPPGGEGI